MVLAFLCGALSRELAMQAQSDLLAPLTEAERGQLHELLLRIALHAHDESAPAAAPEVPAAAPAA